MTRELLAPLSPQQEVALRRIAHGSLAVDDKVVSTLLELALIQRTRAGHRLTPLGRLRYDALPKAPLLARQRSVHAVTGYVEGLIEKAQLRAPRETASAAADAPESPEPTPAGHANEVGEAYAVVYSFFDEQWLARARKSITQTRRLMTTHKQRQARLLDDSRRRIELSHSLLKESAPVRPAWLVALQ